MITVAEVEMETSDSSEVQRTEKLTSNPLVLQSPTHHQISDRSRLYVKQSFSQGQKKGCNDRRYT